MEIFKEKFGRFHGGRVLDVATGKGDFIDLLKDNLAGYSEFIGIDIAERAIQIFRDRFTAENISIVKMSGEVIEYPDASFDTVCLGNSLHHFPDITRVLAEMYRVLKPGGLFFIKEMYYDYTCEPQLTHMLMHHWSAELERMWGGYHDETFSRERSVSIVAELQLRELEIFDISDPDDDPFIPEGIQFIKDSCDRLLPRVENHPCYEEMKTRSEAIKKRTHEVGVIGYNEVFFIGRK